MQACAHGQDMSSRQALCAAGLRVQVLITGTSCSGWCSGHMGCRMLGMQVRAARCP